MATSTQTYEVDIADVEYLRHGDAPLWRVSSSPKAADRSRSCLNSMAELGCEERGRTATQRTKRWRRLV